jgi:hypothetical protein
VQKFTNHLFQTLQTLSSIITTIVVDNISIIIQNTKMEYPTQGLTTLLIVAYHKDCHAAGAKADRLMRLTCNKG